MNKLILPLESFLTKHEAEFVRAVYRNPGCKHPGKSSHWEDDGTEYGKSVNHWETPEKLGLIKCVGSYKWEPTDKIEMGVVNMLPVE